MTYSRRNFIFTFTGVLSRGLSGRGVKLVTHLHLAPRVRMSGAILLFPLYDFMTWTGTTSIIPYSVLDRFYRAIEIVTIWHSSAFTFQSGIRQRFDILVIRSLSLLLISHI